MQLAFSSNAYMNFSIEETIERIASIGYSGLEVLADVPTPGQPGYCPNARLRSAARLRSTACESRTSTGS